MRKRILCLLAIVTVLTACSGASPKIADKYRVYYEIFVGGFYDTTGNGMGDINGIIDRLDYLNDGKGNKNSLGIDGIWLMPIMPSPTYHKYDVTDYKDIDPAYGSMADFERLIAECDKRGIAVIIDLVLNHTSSQHPWFVSASKSIGIPDCGSGDEPCIVDGLCAAHNDYCRYYHFTSDDAFAAHAYPLPNGIRYQAVFWDQMPDLNLSDQKLRGELLDIAQFWIDKGVAGFRLDAVTQFVDENTAENTAFLQWFYEAVKAMNPDIYMVGEAWTGASEIERYYESGLDSFFNFPFSQQSGTIVQAVRNGDGAGLAEKSARWNERIKWGNPDAIDAPFLSNHDNARSAGFLMNNAAMMKICAAVYLFMPGNPFIYYGEEIGMTGSGKDENKRQPMVWSTTDTTGRPYPPSGTDQQQHLDEGFMEQLKNNDSLLRFYIDAIALRNKNPEIARGTMQAVALENNSIMAYSCTYNEETVFVFHNLSKDAVTVALPDTMNKCKLTGSLTAAGGKVSLSGGSMRMPAYSTGVLR